MVVTFTNSLKMVLFLKLLSCSKKVIRTSCMIVNWFVASLLDVRQGTQEKLFGIYHTRISPIKNTEINSFTVMDPIYQIQFLWWTRFFSSCPGIMELNFPEYIKRAETVETFKTRLKTFLLKKHYC